MMTTNNASKKFIDLIAAAATKHGIRSPQQFFNHELWVTKSHYSIIVRGICCRQLHSHNQQVHYSRPCTVPLVSHDIRQVSIIRSIRTSTPSSSSSTLEDLSSKSTEELHELAIQSIRQHETPHNAQTILKELTKRRRRQQQDGPDSQNIDLTSFQTTVIDYWMKYQANLMNQVIQQKEEGRNETEKELNDTLLDDDTTSKHQGQDETILKESYDTANAVTYILETMDQPTSHHYVGILKTWANTCEMAHILGKTKSQFVVGIPQRTQHILNQQQQQIATENIPSIESYNQVIKAWAYSSEYLRGAMAEQVFQQIEYPNGESFRMIIRAHAYSNENRSAFQATGHFMRMMRLCELGKEDMTPKSLDDYYIICHAWTKAKDKNAPSKVYTALEIMLLAYQKGLTDLRPDRQCYRDVLKTMSRRHNVIDVGDLADETMKEMKEQMIYPDTGCYRYAIIAWKHVAMSRDNLYPEQAIWRTEELLQEMADEYHRTTIVTVQPTTEDYNNVLEALTLSKNLKTINRAERLFKTLKAEHASTGGPDPLSYRYMIEILYHSRSPDKLLRSKVLVGELTTLTQSKEKWLKGTLSRDSIVDTFSAFIRVCGSSGLSSHLDIQEKTRNMAMALRCVEDIKLLGLTPNGGTYTALVGACDYLLPTKSEDRPKVLENIFRRACEEGCVNPGLLEQFRNAASTYLYTKLVVAPSIQLEDTKVVPESWTRNVQGFKEGRKVMPLSIHGAFTFTKAAAEYRTRKLRRRTNQRLLRGGRLK